MTRTKLWILGRNCRSADGARFLLTSCKSDRSVRQRSNCRTVRQLRDTKRVSVPIVLGGTICPKSHKSVRFLLLRRFHDLRHTFASRYMMNGGDLYELAKILGHLNIKMTERYAKMGREHITRTGTTAKVLWTMMTRKADEEQGNKKNIT